MSHLDDDLLAGVVIGEHLDAAAAEHLAECPTCQATVAELTALTAKAATLRDEKGLADPPARVWDAIVAELDDEQAGPASPVVSLDSARTRERPRKAVAWLAAAAAVVIGGVGVGLALANTEDAVVVASAELVDLATEADAGTATVEQQPDGTSVLVVNTDTAAVEDADLEVWLIDPNIEGMVSLGFLTSSTGRFAIPAGYDVAEFPIVDVSVEPRDGVPTHSGDSVTRGILAPRA